jgi:hypothetical protein
MTAERLEIHGVQMLLEPFGRHSGRRLEQLSLQPPILRRPLDEQMSLS